jgi:hypothetical protein
MDESFDSWDTGLTEESLLALNEEALAAAEAQLLPLPNSDDDEPARPPMLPMPPISLPSPRNVSLVHRDDSLELDFENE